MGLTVSAPTAERWDDLFRAGKAAGLDDHTAAAYATITAEGERWGVRAAPILSGFRHPTHQRRLQERWDSGDRRGLAARPADSSAHTRRRAFDLDAPANILRGYGTIAGWLRGVRWGGNFTSPDLPHFDTE